MRFFGVFLQILFECTPNIKKRMEKINHSKEEEGD